MPISPDNLTYEEHSLLGSNLPKPELHRELYIVQRKLILPTTRVRSIIRRRNEEGRIAMGLISAVLGYEDLMMNLEDLDKDGKTVRSPRIYNPAEEDLTQRVYQELIEHPIFGSTYRPLLRSEVH